MATGKVATGNPSYKNSNGLNELPYLFRRDNVRPRRSKPVRDVTSFTRCHDQQSIESSLLSVVAGCATTPASPAVALYHQDEAAWSDSFPEKIDNLRQVIRMQYVMS